MIGGFRWLREILETSRYFPLFSDDRHPRQPLVFKRKGLFSIQIQYGEAPARARAGEGLIPAGRKLVVFHVQRPVCGNKVRMIKDPDTGKRLSRPNAKSEWQTTDVPDLRIIPQRLFDAAQNRKKARGQTLPNRQRRPRHMLSASSDADPVVQVCQQAVRISRTASAFVVRQPRKVAHVAMQRHFISLPWNAQFLLA
jgi:hypothetical protein